MCASLARIALIDSDQSRRILSKAGLVYERGTRYHDAEVAVHRDRVDFGELAIQASKAATSAVEFAES